MIMTTSLWMVVTLAFWSQVQCWVTPPPRRVSTRGLMPLKLSSEPSSGASDSSSVPDIIGKDIYQRVFYRLSPFSEVDSYNNIIVEERVRFSADETKGDGHMKPVGPRTLILRDGKVEEGDIGDEVFTINIKESLAEDAATTHGGAGRDTALEATIATLLYLAANPKYVEGSVLEIGCGLGLAGLLGCIGAGALKVEGGTSTNEGGSSPPVAETAADDILTIPKGAPLTDELKQLTLSDGEPESLNLAIANVQLSNIPVNKVAIEELAWRKRPLSRKSPKVYHTIVASELNYNFPEAKELAHTVAHRLEAVSSWEVMKGDSKSAPTFVHVCPDAREDVTYLHRFLTKGYRMNVNTAYVKLEKLIFNYQILPQAEPEEKLDDLELEVLQFKESVYQSLTAEHNPAYADGAGEYFFPMETGEYDSSSGRTYLEPESDGSKWY